MTASHPCRYNWSADSNRTVDAENGDWIFCPGLTPRPMIRRFSAFQPLITEPPLCPSARVSPQRIPHAGEALLVCVAVLADDAFDPIGMTQGDAESHGRTVILNVHIELLDAQRHQQLLHNFGQLVERIGELVGRRSIGVAEARIVGCDQVEFSARSAIRLRYMCDEDGNPAGGPSRGSWDLPPRGRRLSGHRYLRICSSYGAFPFA